MRRETLPALTSLRFFAAMLVVLGHFGWGHAPALTTGAGRAAVDLFFVLSGFILTYSYLDPACGVLRTTTRRFYLAPFARIYPVYLLGLLLAFVPIAWQPPVPTDPPLLGVTITSLLGLQAWVPYWSWVWDSPTWSLSAEGFFYLLFPFLLAPLARLANARLLLLASGLWATALLIAASVASAPPHSLAFAIVVYTPLIRLPSFVFGMAVGRWYLRTRDRPWGRPIALLTPVVLLAWYPALAWAESGSPVALSNGLLMPLAGLTISCLAWGRGPAAALLGCRPLVLLGESSYALYIVHVPIWGWWTHLLPVPQTGAYFWTYVLLVLLAAILVYRYVETPCRRWICNRGIPVARRAPHPEGAPAMPSGPGTINSLPTG